MKHRFQVFAVAGALWLPLGCSAQHNAPIEDQEPQVTQEVRTLLRALADGRAAPERFTGKAATAMASAAGLGIPARLRQCGPLSGLLLLQRSVDGEDRHYRYRIDCMRDALLVDIAFNKAALVDRLTVEPEQPGVR